jgi:hypothetical protein
MISLYLKVLINVAFGGVGVLTKGLMRGAGLNTKFRAEDYDAYG